MEMKKVLFLGSGLMAQSCLDRLCKDPAVRVHIASNILADAQKLATRYPGRTAFSLVNVEDHKSLCELMADSALVISYVPPFLHGLVAKACLNSGKNMITASYISPELKALDQEARAKGLLFLNELGLDPGIDHLSTMRFLDQCRQKGEQVVEYESFCGALPAPESASNPMGYKFTWSPVGALRAANNGAVFIQQGKEVRFSSHQLMYRTERVEVNPALLLEGYANRDSTAYKQLYGLEHATLVKRGTFRYRGYCEMINCFKELDIFCQDKPTHSNWAQLIAQRLASTEQAELPAKVKSKVAEHKGREDLLAKLLTKTVFRNKMLADCSAQQREKTALLILKGVLYYGLLTDVELNKEKSLIENLTALLEKKMKPDEGETDLVVMLHRFLVRGKDGSVRRVRSTLILGGDRGGLTAVAKTVGFTTAIGAQLMLKQAFSSKGVLAPMSKQFYQPILAQLQKDGIRLEETTE